MNHIKDMDQFIKENVYALAHNYITRTGSFTDKKRDDVLKRRNEPVRDEEREEEYSPEKIDIDDTSELKPEEIGMWGAATVNAQRKKKRLEEEAKNKK